MTGPGNTTAPVVRFHTQSSYQCADCVLIDFFLSTTAFEFLLLSLSFLQASFYPHAATLSNGLEDCFQAACAVYREVCC